MVEPLRLPDSELQTHIDAWKECTKCELGNRSADKVFYRWGPTLKLQPWKQVVDVLFVGEAPGSVEAACGEPFIGPIGKLLQTAIKECMEIVEFTYFITNTIVCTPYVDKTLSEIRTPTEPECKQCRPRIDELIKMLEPKVVFALGKISEKSLKLKDYEPIPYVPLKHPAYILRQGGTSSAHYGRLKLTILKELKKIEKSRSWRA